VQPMHRIESVDHSESTERSERFIAASWTGRRPGPAPPFPLTLGNAGGSIPLRRARRVPSVVSATPGPSLVATGG
jgi:hypothetical protein